MVGKKILSFIHEGDMKELTKQFMISPPSSLVQAISQSDHQEEGMSIS